MKADGLKPVVQVATRKPTLASFPWVTEPDIVANDPPNKPSPITIMLQPDVRRGLHDLALAALMSRDAVINELLRRSLRKFLDQPSANLHPA